MGKREVKRRAVFLDRDGVLNRPVVRDGRPFPPATLSEFELFDDVVEGCGRLKAAGFLLIVITNQPDVGRGTQDQRMVEVMHQELCRRIPSLDAIGVCYHGGERYGQPCPCRKPQPGMILNAAAEWQLDLASSYLIGDRWRDVDCAHAAGCRAIFLDRGYAETLRDIPDFTATTFSEAVDVVLREAAAKVSSTQLAPAP